MDMIGYNLYAYVSNNPVNNCNPSGHMIHISLEKVVNAVKKDTKGAKNAVGSAIIC